MRKTQLIVRILFGLQLLFYGFMNLFFPSDLQLAEPAQKFLTSLQDTGYMMMIVYLLQLIVGIFVMIDCFVPLALVVFMPISVNMMLFHIFLDLRSILPALILFLMNVYLMFTHLESYKSLLQAKENE